MSALTCEIIGTGDGKLKDVEPEEALSQEVAKGIVSEIVDNALDIASDTKKVSTDKYKGQIAKQKSSGTGDQKSTEDLEAPEPILYHPPVEKKNRLTDLVKNSKQLLARMILSESKINLEEDKKEEERVVEVIELDCVQLSDLPFKSKPRPEEVPLPDNDSHDLLNPPPSEEFMEEIGLNEAMKAERRRRTFPRASGSKAKAAFISKCRTLKREATNLKKKKWDVKGKIANLFKKKRGKDSSKGKQDLENITENENE